MMDHRPHADDGSVATGDQLPISVLSRLLSPQARTEKPPLPLYRVRNHAEAFVFASIVFDSRRTRQVVLMTAHPRDGWRLEPFKLAEIVGEHADVVLVDDSKTSHAVSEAVTRKFSAWHGEVRVLRPRPHQSDHKSLHPLVRIDDGYDGPQQARIDILRAVDDGVKLARNRSRRDVSEDEVETAVELAVAEEKRKSTEKVRDLTAKLTETKRSLNKTASALADEQRPVYSDPYAQFRFELHHAWLRSTEEGDRDRWALREWELGAGFLDSIGDQQIVDRPRVIRACVDVITGRHAEINSRSSHVLRTSDAGNSPARTREDGSTAWRCSINSGPSAARLMWWDRPDGVIELSLVAQHDDMRII